MKFSKFLLLIAIGLGLAGGVMSQNSYWIGFPDKLGSSYSADHPEKFLSERAIARRTKQNIAITPEDLPVSSQYLDSLKKTGVTIQFTLKWLNGAVVKATPDQLHRIEQLSIIAELKQIFDSSATSSPTESTHLPKISKNYIERASTNDYGSGNEAISMIDGTFLHSIGFTGNGMVIAVIDAGFYHANQVEELQPSFSNSRILDCKDFVSPNQNVFDDNEHGTNVLSIMAANEPNTFIGTAPMASYLLLRSENVQIEQIIEEYTWAAAAEFADSAGADIINSSLGYTTFDVEAQNHSYSELNGNTTPISRACSIAASKGILVVNSAGNEGNRDWKYIAVPADSYGILAVGAVNSNLQPTYFTSLGPSADGRVKPETAALGANIPVVDGDGTIRLSTGTSFSAPVMAGIAACLWQAFPLASAKEIREAILESASQFNAPNNSIGYGIPNMEKAYKLLLSEQTEGSCIEPLIHPNPFFNEIYITIGQPTSPTATVSLYSANGAKVVSTTIPITQGVASPLQIEEQLPNGIYIIEISCGECSWNKKLVKQQ